MIEERKDRRGIEIDELDGGGFQTFRRAHEAQEEPKRIAVGTHRLRAGTLVAQQVLHEEGLHERADRRRRRHVGSRGVTARSKRSPAWARSCGVAVRYQ